VATVQKTIIPTAPASIPKAALEAAAKPTTAAVSRRLVRAIEGAAEKRPAKSLGWTVSAMSENATTPNPPAKP
jgi:hypothetical protein